jgi:hypothetical protein
MIWIFVVAGAVLVVVIALLFIGGSTNLLASIPRQSVFHLPEAVDWVADRLPTEVAAELSYDDVARILIWNLDYLDQLEVPVRDSDAVELDRTVVAEEDEAVVHALACAADEGIEIDPVHVTVVLDLAAGYLRAIGAVGGVADAPDD